MDTNLFAVLVDAVNNKVVVAAIKKWYINLLF